MASVLSIFFLALHDYLQHRLNIYIIGMIVLHGHYPSSIPADSDT